MDSDIPPEEAEHQQAHMMAAAYKNPSQKPSKIPRLVSSPAKTKPHPTSASKVSKQTQKVMRVYEHVMKSLQQHSPPTKPGRSSNRDSEQKEIDEFEEEERRLLELDQQVRELGGISLHCFNSCFICYIYRVLSSAFLYKGFLLLSVALLLMFDLTSDCSLLATRDSGINGGTGNGVCDPRTVDGRQAGGK